MGTEIKGWSFNLIEQGLDPKNMLNRDCCWHSDGSWGKFIGVCDSKGTGIQSRIGAFKAYQALVQTCCKKSGHFEKIIDAGFDKYLEECGGAVGPCGFAACEVNHLELAYEEAAQQLLQHMHATWLELVRPDNPDDCHMSLLFAIYFKNLRCWFLAQLGEGFIATISDIEPGTEALREANCASSCYKLSEDTIVAFPLDDMVKPDAELADGLGANFQFKAWRKLWLPQNAVNTAVMCTEGIADVIAPDQRAKFVANLLCECKKKSDLNRTDYLKQLFESLPTQKTKSIACLQLKPLELNTTDN